MTVSMRDSRLGVSLAQTADDLAACQALRYQCFFGGVGVDADVFDVDCTHIMVAGPRGLVGTCRVMLLQGPTLLTHSYAAQFYDLRRLAALNLPMLEIGRFCVDPSAADSDVLRLAWGAMAAIVDQHDAAFLFGCTSFAQADPVQHASALALLGQFHQGPAALRPDRKAALTTPLVGFGTSPVLNRRQAVAHLPRLLRSYLGLGGWVSDHAVIDTVMNTLHVFTAVEVAQIPPVRARSLRKLAS